MNDVKLIARLTATPELRHTGAGTPVCSFSVATERRFKDADGNAIVDYIDCVAWGKNAEFLCKWFDKGVRVGLSGELQTRRYEKDGLSIKVTEVIINSIEFADGKREANTYTNANTDDDFLPLDADDDLPFLN